MDKRLTFVVGYLLVLLIGFWIYASYPSLTGTDIQLRLVPVDPTDLFAGDYMILRYDISVINTSLLEDSFRAGQKIYVQLNEDVPASAVRFAHEPPSSTFLVGEVLNEQGDVEYGIERFYIPEGSGRDIQVDSSWTARITVDSFGRGMVRELLKDGKPVIFEYKGRQE